MIYKFESFIFQQPTFDNGDEIIACNLMQKFPHTSICEGVSGLKFIRCNLTNCDILLDATVDTCLTRHVEFCANLHPDFGLDAETENCPHVVDRDDIIIDGTLVHTTYTYNDIEVA